jgi:hypothetical protein
MGGSDMAKSKDHFTRLSTLAGKMDSPQVVAEIDKVLRDMRLEWMEMIDLRKGAVRRHGDRGGAPLPLPAIIDSNQDEAVSTAALEQEVQAPKMTVSKLMDLYVSDQDSQYQKLNFSSRKMYDTLMSLIRRDFGEFPLPEITGRVLQHWHAAWSEGGNKVAIAHSKMGMLRRLFAFGVLVLESDECVRLATILRSLRIKSPKRRTERLTGDQAAAIRNQAHLNERPSIALAQAFQFDFGLTQKEIIGEWVPMSEDGNSDITHDSRDGKRVKWLRGIRWEYINDDLILNVPQQTFPDGRVLNLRLAGMVLEELEKQFQFDAEAGRSTLPVSGPIVVSEHDDLPWDAVEFRRWWRRLADAAGIPKAVRNSDSRAKVGRRYPDQDAGDDDIEDHDDEGFEGEEASLH